MCNMHIIILYLYDLYNLIYLLANQSIASGSHSNNSNNASNDWNFPGGQPRPGQRNAQDTTLQGLLSTSPMPEFWCSILYFELDTQVCRGSKTHLFLIDSQGLISGRIVISDFMP